MHKMIGSFLACLFASSALADDPPFFGIMSGHTDGDYIKYQCTPPSQGTITCKFTQVTILKKAKPEDLAKELAKAPEFEKELANQGLSKQECEGLAAAEAALKGGPIPPQAKKDDFVKFMSKPAKEKRDALAVISSVRKTRCEAPTRESIIEMLRLQHDKNVRTCSIFSVDFEQVFERTSSDTWVHTSRPEGQCGAVNVATFEKPPNATKYALWNYRTRKIITNKKGKAFLLSCSDLDEDEYLYDWNTVEFFKECDYVRFGF